MINECLINDNDSLLIVSKYGNNKYMTLNEPISLTSVSLVCKYDIPCFHTGLIDNNICIQCGL